MTIHMNIGEAKAKLSSLIDASLRGEEVILDKAGEPKVRLVPLPEAVKADKEARGRRIDEIIARMHAIPDVEGWIDPLEWDENGLPI